MTLCTLLQEKYPLLCSIEDAVSIDDNCDWSSAKHWAQWWIRAKHLKILSPMFSSVPETLKDCPTTTNAVERKKPGV